MKLYLTISSKILAVSLLSFVLSSCNDIPKKQEKIIENEKNEAKQKLETVEVKSEKIELKISSFLDKKFEKNKILKTRLYHPIRKEIEGEEKGTKKIDYNSIVGEVKFVYKTDTLYWNIVFEEDEIVFDIEI